MQQPECFRVRLQQELCHTFTPMLLFAPPEVILLTFGGRYTLGITLKVEHKDRGTKNEEKT